MAKIGKHTGPSDENQPGERLDLLQAEVVPGSQPEAANEATTAAVVEAAEEEALTPSDGGFLSPEEEDRAATEADDENELDDPDEDDEDEDTDDLPDPEAGESGVTTVSTPAVQFDPSAHTVAEVNEYLDGLEDDDAGKAEYERVLDVESSIQGKGRTGVLTGRV